jgi:hypothetical protein
MERKPLEFFKDWSNYLLVTTVAALGWITTDNVEFWSPTVKLLCIWCFALSIVFAMLTLALIPLIEEQRLADQSIYGVRAKCWVCGSNGRTLRSMCLPQHILFIFGVLLYAVGTSRWLC